MRYKQNTDQLITFSGLILLWFLRMVIPGTKYIFIPTFILFSIYFFVQYRKVYFQQNFITEFISIYTPLIVLGFFYSVGLILTDKLHTINIKDILELFIVLLFFFFYFTLIHQSKSYDTIITIFKKLAKYIGISSVFVALIGVLKFALQINGIDFIDTPFGTSINSDKNFFALYSFLGIISFVSVLRVKANAFQRVTYQLMLFLLILNILFSFSYRGILILVLLFISLLLVYVISLLKSNNMILANIRNNTLLLVLLLIIIVASSKFLNNSFIQQLNHHTQVYFSNSIELTSNAFHMDKWEYAFEYFNNLPITKKIFGDGFNYLEAYGKQFNGTNQLLDYPHNPIISAFLYSGIVGGLFALLFLIISVYYAVLYSKKYSLFALMLIVSLLFVLFSGNSLFSVPIFLFLFSLSFLIRHQEISDLNIDANLDNPGSKLFKELFDYVVASIMFIVLLPLLFTVGVLIFVTMGWPIIYSQTRVGQNGKLFRLHKFRTMKNINSDTTVAAAETYRISKFGAFLRKTKIDELPELINIIRGDMSFVGTRPDVPGYADKLKGVDRIILKLKPGITGPASLKYINEEQLLSEQENPQEYNDEVIWPDKVSINKEYYNNWSFFTDIKIILFTFFKK